MSKKNVVAKIDKKFLLKLADQIYNPKTKKFLRLCDGELQNGPDPTNKKRSMHCALGELYFAATGLQPEDTGVDEDYVVNLVVKHSALSQYDNVYFEDEFDKYIDKIIAKIKSLDLPDIWKEITCNALINHADWDNMSDSERDDAIPHRKLIDDAERFRELINDLQSTNDCAADGLGCDVHSYKAFQTRAKHVAKQLREAAALLPQ